jgi:hypothetical protein
MRRDKESCLACEHAVSRVMLHVIKVNKSLEVSSSLFRKTKEKVVCLVGLHRGVQKF